MDKISYALGLSIGHNFRGSGIDNLNLSEFLKGVEDVLNNKTPAISYEEAKELINNYFISIQEQKGELNRKAGEEFLQINRKKPGITVLSSGLQYEVLKEGTGAKPKATDKVRCHYEGRLIDGRVFDSSIQRGQPATFALNQVISGWTEALQLMASGAKWRLFIPSELAYGSRQAGELIEPNSTLIFDVELLEIV